MTLLVQVFNDLQSQATRRDAELRTSEQKPINQRELAINASLHLGPYLPKVRISGVQISKRGKACDGRMQRREQGMSPTKGISNAIQLSCLVANRESELL